MIALNENPKLLADPDGEPIERIHGMERELLFAGGVWENRADLTEYQLANEDMILEPDPEYAKKLQHTHQFRKLKPRVLIYNALGSEKAYGLKGEVQYEDHEHPEYGTPEGLKVDDTADRVLHGIVDMGHTLDIGAAILARQTDVPKPRFYLGTNNEDEYGNVWGVHENFLARRALEIPDFAAALIAFYVSRICWFGAGTIYRDKERPGSFSYGLSTRAAHIHDEINDKTTSNRPFINTRDEQLAKAEIFRRYHGINAEPVHGPVIMALSLAAQSILLRACEIGIKFDELKPLEPMKAIRLISHDPTLRSVIELANGQKRTAIEHQRDLIAHCVPKLKKAGYITTQELKYVKVWERVLDILESDPHSAEGKRLFDWVIKLQYIDRRLAATRKPGRTDFDIAWQLNFAYHAAWPGEGLALRLIRKGIFEDSPPGEILDNGLPAPPTRAQLRVEAIRRMMKANVNIVAGADYIRIPGMDRTIILGDPYATEDVRLEELLQMASIGRT
jgi:proteasome accessory factor A